MRAECEKAEQLAILRQMQEDFADLPGGGVDEFLADKRAQIELERERERRWETGGA